MTMESPKYQETGKKGVIFRSIRTKLIVSFSLLFLTFLVIIEMITMFGIPFTPYAGRQGFLKKEAFNKLDLVADLKKQRIVGWIEELKEYARSTSGNEILMENLGSLMEIRRTFLEEGMGVPDVWRMLRQEDTYIKLEEFLSSIETFQKAYDRVYIVDMDQEAIIVTTDEKDQGTSFSMKLFYNFSPGPRRDYLTDIIIGPKSGKPALLLGHVITDDFDNAIGLFVMEINAEKVLKPILQTWEALGKESEALLVNREKKILTSPNHSLSSGIIPQALEHQLNMEPVKLAAEGGQGNMETMNYHGVPVLTAYRFIPVSSEWGWGMIVNLDKASLMGPLHEIFLDSFMIGLIGVLVLIGFTIIIVEGLTRPIRSLSWTAIEVAKGDLAARATVTTMDEVGTMATIFNSMIQRIQNWQQELERRVVLRTEELNRANIELQKEIAERNRAERELKKYSEKLEEMVDQRTAELRKAQEDLVRKEKLAILGELAGGVGHELRNPLGVISNAVFFLKSIMSQRDEMTSDYLDIISSEVNNADKIVSDLLDYAQPKFESKVGISLANLVSQVLEQYPPPESVAIHIDLPAHLPKVHISPSQIFKVLFNIILNAYQSMPEGGIISISSSWEDNRIALTIKDTGCGIPPENLKKIFDPLFTTKARGIGLGLSVSRSFVETNGGAIQVESEEGQGTVVIITLPVKEKNP